MQMQSVKQSISHQLLIKSRPFAIITQFQSHLKDHSVYSLGEIITAGPRQRCKGASIVSHPHNPFHCLRSPLVDGAQAGSPYSEGGALYALGLIHANHGGEHADFILEALKNTQVCDDADAGSDLHEQ